MDPLDGMNMKDLDEVEEQMLHACVFEKLRQENPDLIVVIESMPDSDIMDGYMDADERFFFEKVRDRRSVLEAKANLMRGDVQNRLKYLNSSVPQRDEYHLSKLICKYRTNSERSKTQLEFFERAIAAQDEQNRKEMSFTPASSTNPSHRRALSSSQQASIAPFVAPASVSSRPAAAIVPHSNTTPASSHPKAISRAPSTLSQPRSESQDTEVDAYSELEEEKTSLEDRLSDIREKLSEKHKKENSLEYMAMKRQHLINENIVKQHLEHAAKENFKLIFSAGASYNGLDEPAGHVGFFIE